MASPQNFYNTLMHFFSGIVKSVYERNFGLTGGIYTKDTLPVIGRFNTIKADGVNVVFTTLTTAKGDNMDGWILLPGDTVYGDFTGYELSKGNVYAYNKN